MAIASEVRSKSPISAKAEEAGATLIAAALMLAALAVPTVAALVLDDRTIYEASVWEKPLKFELSLIIHLATLALIVRLVAPAQRAGRFVRIFAIAAALSALGEVLYILLQAARGRASHFNSETLVESAMYSLMGLGALILVACAFAYGVMVAVAPRDGIGRGLKLGAVIGLTLGASLTLMIAGLMSTGMVDGPGHWVGGIRSDAQSLPLFGWSTTGGDLRVPHFFATHLMQALPLVGLVADRMAPKIARRLVVLAAAIGLAVVTGVFLQALSGQPLLAL